MTYERAGLELDSRLALKEGCHKFTSGLSVMFSSSNPEPGSYRPIRYMPSAIQLLNMCAYQQTTTTTTTEGVKKIQHGHTDLWLSQRLTLRICAYANIYRNSHLA